MKVPPAELEALLLTHPDVSDVAVIGIPHDLYGEIPRAYVVRKMCSTITESQIQDFVKGVVLCLIAILVCHNLHKIYQEDYSTKITIFSTF